MKFSTKQAIKIWYRDSSYMQRTNVKPQQYGDDMDGKYSIVADVIGEGTENEIIRKSVDASIRQTLSH